MLKYVLHVFFTMAYEGCSWRRLSVKLRRYFLYFSGSAVRLLRTVLLQPGLCKTLAGSEETRSKRGWFFTKMSRFTLQQEIRPLELFRYILFIFWGEILYQAMFFTDVFEIEKQVTTLWNKEESCAQNISDICFTFVFTQWLFILMASWFYFIADYGVNVCA